MSKMKFTQHVIIRDPLDFAKQDYDCCFTLRKKFPTYIDDWIDCGEIEFELDIELANVISVGVKRLDEVIEETRKEFTDRMELLESQKQELLALSWQKPD